ncbi:RHS repeat-associated core domain-containing protein [Lysobacter sp. K5869]|uniref:RHS repeat domain-containing protein n=1 Tax=Lysobacter sp. K5869 TaxID=2820808 RepID=UPI002100EF58|nr:RHS repeat-associated core domain-containing protein [Lysobacter sp. K5869]
MKTAVSAAITIGMLFSLNSSAQTVVEYIHTDALGSPMAITDANQNVVEWRIYEPFGATEQGGMQSGPGYTGHVGDESTQLWYMQQRYYDPGIGRFVSPDPVVVGAGSGVNFNRYWYANNNPYRFVDPDGRYTCAGSKPSCATVEDALQKARQAAEGLPEGSSERTRLTQVVDMFGEAGKKNGVEVTVRDVSRLAGTRTTNGVVRINVSLKAISEQSGGTGSDKFRPELAGIMGHEGDHGLWQRANGMPKNREQAKSMETSAFNLHGQVHRGMQYNGSSYRLWSSYKGIDDARVEQMAEKSVQDWCQQGGAC